MGMRRHDRILETLCHPIFRLPDWAMCLAIPLWMPLIWPALLLYAYPISTILAGVSAASFLVYLKWSGLLDSLTCSQVALLATGHLWFPSLLLLLVAPLVGIMVAIGQWYCRTKSRSSAESKPAA